MDSLHSPCRQSYVGVTPNVSDHITDSPVAPSLRGLRSGTVLKRHEGQDVCSPIEHLAKTLFLSRWSNARFSMLTAAFDASGKEHDQVAVVVAGFVSSTNHWLDFEKKWNDRLGQDGIQYFHMVEFAHCRGQFEGWNNQEKRRRALLSDLLSIITRHCYRKFGCGISVKQWASYISQTNKEDFRITAYCIAAMFVTEGVDRWARSERIENPIELVFEDGDVGKGRLLRYWSTRKPDPLFRPKRDTMLPNGSTLLGFVPLQAADFLAYEILQEIKNNENNMPRHPRYAIEQFYDIPGEIRYPNTEDYKNLDAMLSTAKKRMRLL